MRFLKYELYCCSLALYLFGVKTGILMVLFLWLCFCLTTGSSKWIRWARNFVGCLNAMLLFLLKSATWLSFLRNVILLCYAISKCVHIKIGRDFINNNNLDVKIAYKRRRNLVSFPFVFLRGRFKILLWSFQRSCLQITDYHSFDNCW